MEQLNLEILRGQILSKEGNNGLILYKIKTIKGIYEFNAYHYGKSDTFLEKNKDNFYIMVDGSVPLVLTNLSGEMSFILNPTNIMDNDIYLLNKYRISREILVNNAKKEFEKNINKLKEEKISIVVEKCMLISEDHDTSKGIYKYYFEKEDGLITTLETPVYSKIYNAIINNLGCSVDLRMSEFLDLIIIGGRVCGVYIDNEILLEEYYNGRFDGIEMYLNKCGLTKEKLIETLKGQVNSKKLEKR